MYYLADDAVSTTSSASAVTPPVSTTQLAKTWMIILGATVAIGFMWGSVAERRGHRK